MQSSMGERIESLSKERILVGTVLNVTFDLIWAALFGGRY